MTARFTRPLENGRIQAPAISSSPGWTQSSVIVVFRARKPQFPQKLRDDDDHEARDQSIDGAPRGNVFEPEMRGFRANEIRRGNFAGGEHNEDGIEPARDRHGNALSARVSTRPG